MKIKINILSYIVYVFLSIAIIRLLLNLETSQQAISCFAIPILGTTFNNCINLICWLLLKFYILIHSLKQGIIIHSKLYNYLTIRDSNQKKLKEIILKHLFSNLLIFEIINLLIYIFLFNSIDMIYFIEELLFIIFLSEISLCIFLKFTNFKFVSYFIILTILIYMIFLRYFSLTLNIFFIFNPNLIQIIIYIILDCIVLYIIKTATFFHQ